MNNNAQLNTDKMRHIARYLSYGWALVPLHHIGPNGCTCTRGTEVCPSAGKHPVYREWHAPLNLIHDMAGWHDRHWNVGIATGAPSGMWVLDYDPAAAERAGSAIETEVISIVQRLGTPHVLTGGQGNHWRFAMPADFEPTNRRGSLPAGLDVRGTGGQVVAPPSVSGKGAYVELSDAAPYVAPGWLLDMIRPAQRLLPTTGSTAAPAGWSPDPYQSRDSSGVPRSGGGGPDDRGQRYAAGAVRALLDQLAGAPEGTRNDTAFRVAARLVELGNAGWTDADQIAAGVPQATEALERLSRVFARRRRRGKRRPSEPTTPPPSSEPS